MANQMMPPGQSPPGPPQRQQAPPQRKAPVGPRRSATKPFPANKKEGVQFKAQIIKMMHTPEVRDQLIGMLEGSQNLQESIAQVATMIMIKAITSIPGVPRPDYMAKVLYQVVREVFMIGDAAGLWKLKDVPKEAAQQVYQMAAQMLDQKLAEIQEQGQQGPPQQALGGM